MNWMARYTEAAPKKLDWHCYFALVASEVERLRQGDECVFSSLAAEQSDFIRFNGGKVRQIGNVSQGKLTLRLIDGERQAYSTLTVSCEPAADFGRVAGALKTLREGLCDAPDDPHLMVDRSSSWTQSIRRTGTLPDPAPRRANRRTLARPSRKAPVLQVSTTILPPALFSSITRCASTISSR
jgi:hypothetical protein